MRTGPLVGRIIAVENGLFTLDYGLPFGGETLVCDVVVEPQVKIPETQQTRKEK